MKPAEVGHLTEQIRLLASFRHENIVKIYGTGRKDNFLNIFMEYLPGGSVTHLVRKEGPLDEQTTSEYTRQMLKGLEYLHGENVVHRDVKGLNVLLTADQKVVKLIDFELTKQLGEMTRSMTTAGRGTTYYMAPEIAAQDYYGTQSDIWSLACTVVEMQTGYPPYYGVAEPAAHYKIASGEPPSYRLPDNSSGKVQKFLSRCFQYDRKKRPTASELLRDPFIDDQTPETDGEHDLREKFMSYRFKIDTKLSGLLAHLYSKGLIEWAEKEDLEEVSSSCRRNERLVSILSHKSIDQLLEQFEEALRATGQGHTVNSDYAVNYDHLDILRRKYAFLRGYMDSRNCGLLDNLYNKLILEPGEMEYVESADMFNCRNERLLSILHHKSFRQFQLFLSALEETGQQHLVDNEPPVITLEPVDQNVVTDENCQFIVEIKANPEPTIHWYYYDDRSFETGATEKVSSHTYRSTLLVKKVTMKDAGLYSVRAFNSAGEVRSVRARLCVTAGIRM
jgi:serine/threonine protein kinase